MRYLILFLVATTCYAGPFAEVALTARQPYANPGNTYVDIDGQKVQEQVFRLYDVNVTRNPYCSVMVGYQWRLNPEFQLGLAIHHESSIATGKDRGINDLRLTLMWE